MTYKLNNNAVIEFKNGTKSEIKCSYVSYGKNFTGHPDTAPSPETVKFHGVHGVPTTIISMSEIALMSVTDNPVENTEAVEDYAVTAAG